MKRLDASVTFKWFYTAKYLPTVKAGWKPSTLYKNESLFNSAILPVFGDVPLQDIDKAMICDHLAKLAETKSKCHIMHVRQYIKAVLEEAVEQDLLAKNAARKIKLPRCSRQKATRFLEVQEIPHLLAQMKEQHALMVEVAIYGGLRANELFALRINDLQPGRLYIDEGVWEGQFDDPKTPSSKAFVSIPKSLYKRLVGYVAKLKNQDGDALLFPGRNGKVWRANNFLNRVLKPAAERAELDGVTIQSLRRTTATHLSRRATVSDTKNQMRHSTSSTTFDFYAQSIAGSQTAAVEAFASEVPNVLNISEHNVNSESLQVVEK